MTRDAFIRKWLDSKKPYNDENRMAMLDDLDKVIARGMATDNIRLAELEAQGWKWWVEYRHDESDEAWYALANKGGAFDKYIDMCDTKSEAEAACIQYLLNLKTEQQ